MPLEAGERACPICGADLAGKRSHAETCGGACRAELSRLRRILSGREADGFRTLADRRKRARKRTELNQ